MIEKTRRHIVVYWAEENQPQFFLFESNVDADNFARSLKDKQTPNISIFSERNRYKLVTSPTYSGMVFA